MHILSVILLSKKSRKSTLTYFSAKDVPPGAVVSIPLRTANETALVVATQKASESKSAVKQSGYALKKIGSVLGYSSLSPAFIAACREASRRFALPEDAVLLNFFPVAERELLLSVPPVAHVRGHVQPEKLLFQAPEDERILFYKTFIRQSFARGESVFMMVPTVRDTERFKELLSRGIEEFVVTLHGDLSKTEQEKRLRLAAKEAHPLFIIGTPSFIGAKAPLAAIIVEKEHTRHYRGVMAPHIDSRVFAELYASVGGTKLILADSLLRTETLGRYYEGAFGEVAPLSFRRTSGSLKESIVQWKNDDAPSDTKEKWSLLTPPTTEEIRRTLAAGGRVFLFTLRKDIAHSTICSNCNAAVLCGTCSAPLVLRKGTPASSGAKRAEMTEFFCPRCRNKEASLRVCGTCGGWNLTALGTGADRVIEEATKLFAGTPIIAVDEKKVAKKYEKAVDTWRDTSASILVGTEVLLPYLDSDADLTVIVSIDSLFSVPDFRIADRILHLLFDIRKSAKGMLIMQTKNKDEEILSVKPGGMLADFCKKEIEERREWNYPPFARFIKVSWSGPTAKEKAAKEEMKTLFGEYQPHIEKETHVARKGSAGLKMLIKIPAMEWTSPEEDQNGHIDEKLLSLLLYLSRDYTVIVDPETLL